MQDMTLVYSVRFKQYEPIPSVLYENNLLSVVFYSDSYALKPLIKCRLPVLPWVSVPVVFSVCVRRCVRCGELLANKQAI